MRFLERIAGWNERRAAVEMECAKARRLGFAEWEVRQLRRTAYYLARTFGRTPGHHAKATLRGMVNTRANSATSRTMEER